MNSSIDFSYQFLSDDAFKALKKLEFSEKGTRRLCLHKNDNSKMHMMLIEIKRNTIYNYHCHTHSDEVVFLIEGQLTYEFINKNKFILSEETIKSFIIPQGEFHKVTSGSQGATYIEIINGPFLISNTQTIKTN